MEQKWLIKWHLCVLLSCGQIQEGKGSSSLASTHNNCFQDVGEAAGLTWNTVRSACGKLSKVLRLVWVSSKLNFPPNSCIPSKEKMMIKRKSNNSSEAMDFMEFNKDATKLLREVQCLQVKMRGWTQRPWGKTRASPDQGGNSQANTSTVPTSLPGHFEDPQEAHTPEHRDPQRRHELQLHQDGFSDPPTHHKAIKPVEERDKICLEAQAVHLHQHLTGEQSQEDFVCNIWKDKCQACSSSPTPPPSINAHSRHGKGSSQPHCCTGDRDHPYCCWPLPRCDSGEVTQFL